MKLLGVAFFGEQKKKRKNFKSNLLLVLYLVLKSKAL